jgi:hypothetical protein
MHPIAVPPNHRYFAAVLVMGQHHKESTMDTHSNQTPSRYVTFLSKQLRKRFSLALSQGAALNTIARECGFENYQKFKIAIDSFTAGTKAIIRKNTQQIASAFGIEEADVSQYLSFRPRSREVGWDHVVGNDPAQLGLNNETDIRPGNEGKKEFLTTWDHIERRELSQASPKTLYGRLPVKVSPSRALEG